MDDAAIRAALVRQFEVGRDIDQTHEIYHDDAVLEFPQSGERFIGKQDFLTWRRQYPAEVDYRLRRITGHDGLWVVELLVSYDGSPPMFGLGIVQFRGDRISRESIYVMEGFEAAAWRTEWATPFDPLASVSPASWDGRTAFGIDPSPVDPGDGLHRGHVTTDAAVREALVRHWEFEGLDYDKSHEIYHDDAVLEFPQSGERFIGKTNFLTWRKRYPANLQFRIRRITGRDDLWVVEYLISYDGSPWMFTVNIARFRDGKIATEAIYIMEGFEAAQWRAEWATRFDPLASVAPADWMDGVPFGLDLEMAATNGSAVRVG